MSELSNTENSKSMRTLLEQTVEARVEKSKQEMESDFANHPVTKELDNGPSSSNVSNTLGGYGNLFSFIGLVRRKSLSRKLKKRLKNPSKLRQENQFLATEGLK